MLTLNLLDPHLPGCQLHNQVLELAFQLLDRLSGGTAVTPAIVRLHTQVTYLFDVGPVFGHNILRLFTLLQFALMFLDVELCLSQNLQTSTFTLPSVSQHSITLSPSHSKQIIPLSC